MYKVAVCDDESEIRRLIASYARDYFKEQDMDAVIIEYNDGSEIVPLYENDAQPFDILLLDGKMKDIDGYQLSQSIRKYDKRVVIIFISSWDDYAIKGYEVRAHRFVRKSTKRLRCDLFAALTSAVKEMIAQEKRFPLKCKSGTKWYAAVEIRYIEVYDRELTVHMDSFSDTATGKLSDLAQQLKVYGFIQCHKSYLINMAYIRVVKAAWVQLTDGREIPLGRSYRQSLNDAFTSYLGEGD